MSGKLFACFVIGLGMAGFSFTIHPIPENELKLVEGVPSNQHLVRRKRSESFVFQLADKSFDISKSATHYDEIVNAVQSGNPVKAWVENSSNDIYKMTVNEKPILTYAESVQDKDHMKRTGLGFGLCLMLVGSLTFFGMFNKK